MLTRWPAAFCVLSHQVFLGVQAPTLRPTTVLRGAAALQTPAEHEKWRSASTLLFMRGPKAHGPGEPPAGESPPPPGHRSASAIAFTVERGYSRTLRSSGHVLESVCFEPCAEPSCLTKGAAPVAWHWAITSRAHSSLNGTSARVPPRSLAPPPTPTPPLPRP